MAGTAIRVANAGGYWGDDPDALLRVLRDEVDYITLDFLAETTMSILEKQRREKAGAGFAHDFPRLVLGVLPELLRRKIKVVANAGGVSPEACAEAVLAGAKALGLSPRVAVVTGDDLKDRLGAIAGPDGTLRHLETGEALGPLLPRVASANAYFGAQPIAKALALGADIVITGRVADASLVVGPCLHEFGWPLEAWDALAGATIAGHLVECGAQVTGGNHCDWKRVPSLDAIGYPIVEIANDGSFVLTKPAGTGGLVSLDTVKEQLLYEIGDPSSYLTPDVTADFTSVTLELAGSDRVRVSGAKGRPPSDHYKVSVAYDDGYRMSGGVLVGGPDALAKARAYADLFWKRVPPLAATRTEYVGAGAFHGALGFAGEPEEIWLRLSARDGDRKKLGAAAKLLPALLLSGPPGLTFTGGIPKVQEVVSFWPGLVPKAGLAARVTVVGEGDGVTVPGAVAGEPLGTSSASAQVAAVASRPIAQALADRGDPGALTLSTLALARSGDKGDRLNLGVVARDAAAFEFLKKELTAQRVKDWFQELCEGPVTRYELPNVNCFNFVLERALGGGGMTTLRLDSLGKTLGQALLRQKIRKTPP